MEDKVGLEASQEDIEARETYVKAVRKGVKRLNYREGEETERGAPEVDGSISFERDPQSQVEKRIRIEPNDSLRCTAKITN